MLRASAINLGPGTYRGTVAVNVAATNQADRVPVVFASSRLYRNRPNPACP